jgi:hypothetical protein
VKRAVNRAVNRAVKRLVAGFALLGSVAFAHALVQDDFAYRVGLLTEQPEGLHSLSLGDDVLRAAATADLRDLRIFNAGGEALAIAALPALPPPEPDRGPLTAVHMVPLPPAPKAQERALAEFAVRLERDGSKTTLELSPGGESAAGPSGDSGGYLMDLRPLKDKAGELALEFSADAPDFAGHVNILGSDDLVSWRVLAMGPLAHNRSLGNTVDRATFYLSRPPAFGRISWGYGSAPQLIGAGFTEHVPPVKAPLPRTRLALTISDAGGWLVDLPVGLPITRIAIRAPQENQSLRLDIYCPTEERSRRPHLPHVRELAVREAPSPWFVCARGVGVYKVDSGGKTIENAPIALPLRAAELRLEVVDPKDYRGAPPVVEAEWRPLRIAFLARAPGPYRLAVGRADADPGPRLDVAALLPSDDPSGAKLPLARVAPGEPGTPTLPLSTAPRADQSGRWRMGLWAVLLLAVGALAAMAWRLARQIKSSGADAGND